MEQEFRGLIGMLPAASGAKIRALAEQRSDLYAIVRSALAQEEAAWAALEAQQVAFARWQEASRSLIPSPSEAEVAAARAPLARAEQAVEQAKAKTLRATEAWQTTDYLSEVRDWLIDAKRSGLRLKHSAAPAPRGDFFKVVEGCRRELDRIEMDLDRVSNASRTLAELRRAVEVEIDRLASPPSVDLRARETSPVRVAAALSVTRTSSGETISDPLGLVLWGMRDQLLDRCLALLPTKEPEGSLSDTDRDAAFDRLAAERLATERQEEAAISAAAAAGINIPRRRDADARAILEVEGGR